MVMRLFVAPPAFLVPGLLLSSCEIVCTSAGCVVVQGAGLGGGSARPRRGGRPLGKQSEAGRGRGSRGGRLGRSEPGREGYRAPVPI